jgi:hypothetical protein
MGQQEREPVTRHRYSVLGDFDPPFVDASVPNVARIYDYLLGGKDNFAADREAATSLIRLIPDALQACRENRQFLQRAVRFLAREAGIRQFIDIGTGLPTQGNVHETAHGIEPHARVVYVDYDPVVVSHAQALLAASQDVAVINRDLRRPEEILEDPVLRAYINLDEPVAVLLVAVLHFLTDDDDPWAIAGRVMAAMPAGSYLVLSHITADDIPDEADRKARDVYQRATAPAVPRSRGAIARFFDGLEILEPGVTDIGAWRTGELPSGGSRTLLYAGMGRKPGPLTSRSGDTP